MLIADFSNPVLVLGIILIFAALLGDATERLGVPWVTGCILAGILLGPDTLGLLTSDKVSALGGFLQASLALIAFNIGSQLTLGKLRKIGLSIVLLTLAQLVTPMLTVLTALMAFGIPFPVALIAAAVAPATAPTTTYTIFERRNASGPFVDLALGILAVNDSITIITFSVISAIAIALLGAQGAQDDFSAGLCAALRKEGLSIITGAALGACYVGARALIGYGRSGWQDRLRAILFALLLLTVGLSMVFGLSHLLTPLVMGGVIANVGKDNAESAGQTKIGDIEHPLYMTFFVLAGAKLPVADLFGASPILMAGIVYVLSRIGGKYIAIFTGATALRLDRGTRYYLGLCFSSQGGAAMGLVLSCAGSPAAKALPPTAYAMVEIAVSIVLMGVLITQLLGPVVLDYAVRHGVTESGEA